MFHPLNLQGGSSLPEVLVAMALMVMFVTALSGYPRVLMHRFELRHQYLHIW
ncbi:prepilin peptidase dependent protein C, partial [Salmonella enterica subsp. enterica serovar Typhimurium]